VNLLGTNDVVKWVLCSRVALDRFPFWRICIKVDIYRFGSADLDLLMSCGKETLAKQTNSNHRYFSVKKTRSTELHHSLIYETWILIRDNMS
jgi:hypothetical protein